MSNGTLTPYQRIKRASEKYAGLRLSAEDVSELYLRDEMIASTALQDEEAQCDRSHHVFRRNPIDRNCKRCGVWVPREEQKRSAKERS